MKCLVLLAFVPLALCQFQLPTLGGVQFNQAKANKNIDEILSNGKDVINGARMDGVQVRLCTCQEQQRCVQHMQEQTRQCSQQCWGVYDKISRNPQAMYRCAKNNEDLLTGMVSCLSNLIDSCSNTPTQRTVPKSNIAVMLDAVEQRIQANRAKFLEDQVLSTMKEVVTATFDLGKCVKECFINKNRQEGACFDHFNCQPYVAGDAFSQAAKRCADSVQAELKSRSKQLCQCATEAGIRSTAGSCTALNVASSLGQQGGLVGALSNAALAGSGFGKK